MSEQLKNQNNMGNFTQNDVDFWKTAFFRQKNNGRAKRFYQLKQLADNMYIALKGHNDVKDIDQLRKKAIEQYEKFKETI